MYRHDSHKPTHVISSEPTPIVFAQVSTGALRVSSLEEADVDGMMSIGRPLCAALAGKVKVPVPDHHDLYMQGVAVGSCCVVEVSSKEHGVLLTVAIAADPVEGACLWSTLNTGELVLLDPETPPPTVWCGARWEEPALSAPMDYLIDLPHLVMCLGWTWMVFSGITN